MKVKMYSLLERAVEEGFRRGYRQAFKHAENPPPPLEANLEDKVVTAIMGEICEIFSFDDESNDSW